MKIEFEINDLSASDNSMEDAFERAVFSAVEEDIRSKLANVRDPDTGEFPVVVVRGRNPRNLSFEVSGSE